MGRASGYGRRTGTTSGATTSWWIGRPTAGRSGCWRSWTSTRGSAWQSTCRGSWPARTSWRGWATCSCEKACPITFAAITAASSPRHECGSGSAGSGW